jgi:hypothetical protein
MRRITVSKLNYVLLGCIFIIALFFSPNFSIAVNPCPDFDITTPPFDDGLACLIIWVLHAVFLLSGVLLFFLLLLNGIRYFFVFGNPKKLKEIRANIKSAFIGTIILLLVVTITTFLNPELLLHKDKPDVDLVISLQSIEIDIVDHRIVLRDPPLTHRDIFYNPDVSPANVSFNIFWIVRGKATCTHFYKTPAGAVVKWRRRADRLNYRNTGIDFFDYVITIRTTYPEEAHAGTYAFGLRCYDNKTKASITRDVVVNLRFVQAQLSQHRFQGNHNCDDNPRYCCPEPIHQYYKWEICTKEMLTKTIQPYREILGTGRGWMRGRYHCNNWNNAVAGYGGTFNTVGDITMFHRAACNIPHHVWCCMTPVIPNPAPAPQS